MAVVQFEEFPGLRFGELEVTGIHRIQRVVGTIDDVVRVDRQRLAPRLSRPVEVQVIEIRDGKIVEARTIRRVQLGKLRIALDAFFDIAGDGKVVQAQRAITLPFRHRVHHRHGLLPELFRFLLPAKLEQTERPARQRAGKIGVLLHGRLVIGQGFLVLGRQHQFLRPGVVFERLQRRGGEGLADDAALARGRGVAEVGPHIVRELADTGEHLQLVPGHHRGIGGDRSVLGSQRRCRQFVFAVVFGD